MDDQTPTEPVLPEQDETLSPPRPEEDTGESDVQPPDASGEAAPSVDENENGNLPVENGDQQDLGKPEIYQPECEMGQPEGEMGQPEGEMEQPEGEMGQPEGEMGQPDCEISQPDREMENDEQPERLVVTRTIETVTMTHENTTVPEKRMLPSQPEVVPPDPEPTTQTATYRDSEDPEGDVTEGNVNIGGGRSVADDEEEMQRPPTAPSGGSGTDDDDGIVEGGLGNPNSDRLVIEPPLKVVKRVGPPNPVQDRLDSASEEEGDGEGGIDVLYPTLEPSHNHALCDPMMNIRRQRQFAGTPGRAGVTLPLINEAKTNGEMPETPGLQQLFSAGQDPTAPPGGDSMRAEYRRVQSLRRNNSKLAPLDSLPRQDSKDPNMLAPRTPHHRYLDTGREDGEQYQVIEVTSCGVATP